MEKFELDLKKVIGAGKCLLRMMENKKRIPHVIGIRNIPYLVIPNAVRFFNHFKKLAPTLIENSDGSILTMDNFNNYVLVPAPETRINIFSDGKFISAIDIFAGVHFDIVGTFGKQYIEGIEHNYRFLEDILPFDLNIDTPSSVYRLVISGTNILIETSILILTFIYTLCNLNEKVRIVSNSDPSDVATQYIEELRKELSSIGDGNFVDTVENLYLLKVLMYGGVL